jgi:hypothetical protein
VWGGGGVRRENMERGRGWSIDGGHELSPAIQATAALRQSYTFTARQPSRRPSRWSSPRSSRRPGPRRREPAHPQHGRSCSWRRTAAVLSRPPARHPKGSVEVVSAVAAVMAGSLQDHGCASSERARRHEMLVGDCSVELSQDQKHEIQRRVAGRRFPWGPRSNMTHLTVHLFVVLNCILQR